MSIRITRLICKLLAATGLVVGTWAAAQAQTAEPAAKPANPQYEPERAKRLGASPNGMRNYVLVLLKTGPNKVPAGPERNEMFAGHFANIKRLSDEGKLVTAGPADGVDGWRGIFIFAVKEIEEAKQLTATDPVIIKGEMVAEYHKMYMSAALMEIPEIHKKLSEKLP
ncbi:MAG: hypothetical protein CFE43_05325 [Burkholderiales bacterium PBB3]|nr:MAG: hypothetical protein CFE43_05325 [Burkholderiales bacterium PBB3]